jgi:hypothetical protein
VTPKNENPNPKPDDVEQSKKFEEAARQLEVDESGKKLEKAFKAVISAQGRQSPAKAIPSGRSTP